MEKKEKENVIEFGGRSYGKASIQEILQRCDLLVTDNVALMKVNKSLKFQLGGLKTSNANYRKQVEKLKGEVEHYKNLDIEGDELYEKKIAECEELQNSLKKANKRNDGLVQSITAYTNQCLEYQDRISELKGEIEKLNETIEYEKMPWWKKIF